MSNHVKYNIYFSLYSIGTLFCTGVILQTFLLECGFTEQQVYLYNSLIQFVQVAVMIGLVFFAGKFKRTKKIVALTGFVMACFATLLLTGALFPSIHGQAYVLAVFIACALLNVMVGFYMVLSYCLPYEIIDMRDYGRLMANCAICQGITSFAASALYTFVISKVTYFRSMTAFWSATAVMLILSTLVCLSLKELPHAERPEKESERKDLIAVFKNRTSYILLIPNFTRGIATGIMTLVTVLAISESILNTASLEISSFRSPALGSPPKPLFCSPRWASASSSPLLWSAVFGCF